MDFCFDKLSDGFNSGLVKRVEGLWDVAHNGKPEHIDLHVFTSNGGIKYTNLSGVDNLSENCPWLKPGDTFKF